MADKMYYVELVGGARCFLVAAENMAEAHLAAREEVGRCNYGLVRLATEDDVALVRAMGGYVPPDCGVQAQYGDGVRRDVAPGRQGGK